jgi:hypothetical protein
MHNAINKSYIFLSRRRVVSTNRLQPMVLLKFNSITSGRTIRELRKIQRNLPTGQSESDEVRTTNLLGISEKTKCNGAVTGNVINNNNNNSLNVMLLKTKCEGRKN